MFFLKSLWFSPTFTQYSKYLSTFGAFLFVLPLVFSSYNTIEISVWLLISTVNMFSYILSQRLQITFMRIISFAYAGAKDYSPIVQTNDLRGKGEPNWKGLKNIFVTLKNIYVYVSFFTTLIVLIGLYFGIKNLYGEIPNNGLFLLIIVGVLTFVIQILTKYNIFLLGLNEVALVNRWNTLFGIINILGAIYIIKLGVNIELLVFWQLLLVMLSFLRDKLLFINYMKKKKISNDGIYDKKIIDSIKSPLIKGFISHFSQVGLVQFSGIIITMYASSDVVASYLFALRIITILIEFSQIPYNSLQPYFSKLKAEGNITLLSSLVQKRIFISILIYSLGIIVVLQFNKEFLQLINSNISFLDSKTWLLLGFLYGIERLNILYQSVLSLGNYVVLYVEQFISAIISIGLLLFFVEEYGLWAIVLSIFLPRILIFNINGAKLAANSLDEKLISFIIKTIWPIFLVIFLYFKEFL